MSCAAAIKRGKDERRRRRGGWSPTRANTHGLSLDLRRRRFKGRRTLAPESLFTGEHLRAVLMTILCDRYLSCRVPAAACIPPSATRIFSLAPIQAARNRHKPHSSSSGELRN